MKESYTGGNLDVGLLESFFEDMTFKQDLGMTSQEKNWGGVRSRQVGGWVWIFQAWGKPVHAVSEFNISTAWTWRFSSGKLGFCLTMKPWKAPAFLEHHSPVRYSHTAWSWTSLPLPLSVMIYPRGAFFITDVPVTFSRLLSGPSWCQGEKPSPLL